jgi:hypothetical protein
MLATACLRGMKRGPCAANRENYLIELWAKAIDGNGQPAC